MLSSIAQVDDKVNFSPLNGLLSDIALYNITSVFNANLDYINDILDSLKT